MPDPAARKIVFARKTEAVCPRLRIRHNLPDHVGRFRWNPLVGVQHKDPGPAAPVDGDLLLRAETVPGFGVKVASELRGNRGRRIAARGIDHDDLGGKGDALQAAAKVFFFVFRDDGHGKGNFFHPIPEYFEDFCLPASIKHNSGADANPILANDFLLYLC